jgi:hypothetical protein
MFNVGSEGRLGHVQLKNGELARRAARYGHPDASLLLTADSSSWNSHRSSRLGRPQPEL